MPKTQKNKNKNKKKPKTPKTTTNNLTTITTTIYNKLKLNSQITIINSLLTTSYINDRIRRFLRSTDFKSDYIFLMFKVRVDNGQYWYTLGSNTIINIKDPASIEKYINMVTYKFNEIEEWYKMLNPDAIVYQCYTGDHNDYMKAQINLELSKVERYLDKPIIKKIRGMNIPFNTIYETWWLSIIRISTKLIIIKNIIFDKNKIDKITVLDIKTYTKKLKYLMQIVIKLPFMIIIQKKIFKKEFLMMVKYIIYQTRIHFFTMKILR